MSCADERKPPSKEYLLLEANPPRNREYTPSDVIPRMNSSPTLTWAMSQWKTWPNQLLVPHGITAYASNAAPPARLGPTRYRILSRSAGATFSLKNSFNPSAAGCSMPNGPTRLGP